MWSLGPLSFAAPWVLPALAALPVLWWLLRVTPPAPRQVAFPAVRLLFGLAGRERSTARTPWWLVLLRLVAMAVVILAVAGPLLYAAPAIGPRGPLLVAIDDGWTAARPWQALRSALEVVLAQAAREDRPVVLLPTAPPADGGPVIATPQLRADQARALAQALVPLPWPNDRGAARQALEAVPRQANTRVVWLSDGIDSPGALEFGEALRGRGVLAVMIPPAEGLAHLLSPPAADGALAPVIAAAAAGHDQVVAVRAADAGGRTLARQPATIAAGKAQATPRLDLPVELRNRIARLEIEGEGSAGATILMDERWRRRPVGLVESGHVAGTPLLDDLYYVERALAPFAELRRAAADDLLKRETAVLVMGDVNALPDAEAEHLRHWVEGGGVLVRFAGPLLARAGDALLPVRLRQGGRTLGGAMSWTAPMPLAAFPTGSPFAGLAVPSDVRVKAQVLAEPELDLNTKTWARLTDGTPLVTGAPAGRGWLVLVHTTATPAWSNLSLSGLFVDMLRRLVELSQGVAADDAGAHPLRPIETLDGFGRLVAPGGAVAPLPPEAAGAVPGPRHPPGFYGEQNARRAFNLGGRVAVPAPLRLPPGVVAGGLATGRREIDLRPWLLSAALLLAALDGVVALVLRGLLGRRAAAAAPLVLALLLALAWPGPARADGSDQFALQAATATHLAFVRTGDAAADQISRAGLAGLTAVLARRSTAVLGEPMAVELETDPLPFFPLLYWRMAAGEPLLSEAARGRINDYLRNGGMILFDTADAGLSASADDMTGPGAGELRRLTEGLAMPPLTRLPEDHVLNRSFYLLRDQPGRWTGGSLWVERTDETINDGVSTVVVGANDWASAWAVDDRGRPQFAVVPGGEEQREQAFRFGVNLVMYALTGNYKSDQVHLPAIMERLRQ